MGVSTNGILIYGVDLGELELDESDGYVQEDACDECAATDWEVRCGGCFDGVASFLEAKLEAAGIEGVQLTLHCSLDSPMYLLGVRTCTAYRGDPVTVSAETL